MIHKLKRTFFIWKNRLHSFFYVKKIMLLDYLVRKDKLVARHAVHNVKTYPLEGPEVYKHFEVFRATGIVSYVIHRIITVNEVWYYPKWKEDRVENALLVLANSSYQEIEVKTRAQLKSFLLHPPHFEPSLWVSNDTMTEIAVFEHRFTPFPAPIEGPIEKPVCNVTRHRIDLSKALLQGSGKFVVDTFKQEKPRILKALSDAMLSYLEERGEEIQAKICDLSDSHEINKDICVVEDMICPNCQHVVVHFKRPNIKTCVNHCDPYYTCMLVSRLDWLKALEKDRQELNHLVDLYGIDI